MEACQRTRLSPVSGGRITLLGDKNGEFVKKGQVILCLWNKDQKAQSDYAKKQVTSSQRHILEVRTE